ncbi:hypothetical protein [Halopelagius longus]|uniref:Uncharacterized protein n=1 Tax=Halopelagius longus TaxID=1236180 RepID=A0A1H0YH11_9EURY|nr:hypothetical protein [Halopelagius longus]RDI72490.1 hypothetical protein DWB78_12600 [Halopelagius longus]SDQ14515.1 hypothetical protein SAMN05216278_0634 [Halopelagius longus]
MGKAETESSLWRDVTVFGTAFVLAHLIGGVFAGVGVVANLVAVGVALLASVAAVIIVRRR